MRHDLVLISLLYSHLSATRPILNFLRFFHFNSSVSLQSENIFLSRYIIPKLKLLVIVCSSDAGTSGGISYVRCFSVLLSLILSARR